jgi:hypothetical protein
MEGVHGILVTRRRVLHGRGDFLVELVQTGIRVRPMVLESGLIQGTHEWLNRRRLSGSDKQGGAGRNQQANRILDRIDGINQILCLHNVEHLQIIIQRGPWSKGDQ